MKNIKEALEYEVKSNWLAPYVSFGWGQQLISWWIAKKTARKWMRYKYWNKP